jgi:hypothetical protein
MPFQSSTPRQYLAPGIEGGWASFNPHVSLLQPNTGDLSEANAASWKVGPGGAIVGRFAFADVVTGQVTSAHPGTGANFVEGSNGQPGRVRVGFVQRDQIVLITTWLGENGSTVQPGAGITLITRGDVWARFAAGAAVGSFVFASYADGSAIAGSTSTPPTGAAVTVTNTSGQPTLTVTSGTVPAVGTPLTGTGVPAGAYVVSVAGNVVTMSANSTAGVTSVTPTTGFLTQYRVDSLAAAGDIAKISVWG